MKEKTEENYFDAHLRKTRIIARSVMFVLSLFFLVFAVMGFWFYFSNKLKCTVKTEAVVVQYKAREDEDEYGSVTTEYTPVYRYSYNGKRYMSSNSTYDKKPLFDIGEMVEIYIDPDKPSEIFVPQDKSELHGALFLLALWGGCVIFGVILLPSIMWTYPKRRK